MKSRYEAAKNVFVDSVDIVDQDITITDTMFQITGIPKFNANDIKIYPNPSNGLFNIEILNSDYDSYTIRIFDVLGSLIFNTQMSGSGNVKQQIDLTKYPKGMYFVSIESENTYNFFVCPII